MPGLSHQVQAIWPLTENFEYAAEVGLELRRLQPDWWELFEGVIPARERFVLAQAQGFAFMSWLEDRFADPDGRLELLLAVERVLRAGPAKLRSELRASADCMTRDYTERLDPDPAPEVFGERASLYAPAACSGYPDGKTAFLDDWTAEALDGVIVTRHDSAPARPSDLLLVHDRRYIEGLMDFALAGGGLLTPETEVTVDTPEAVLAGAGAVIEASRRALAGELGPHLVLSRPGSHHAERSRGGGTCLVNNLAVGAAWALRRGMRSVAVVDLDAHHGNGTEHIFREDDRVFCLSVHQEGPFFPGTGSREEQGRGAGRGSNLNVTVDPQGSAAQSDWLSHVKLGLSQVARRRPRLVLVQFSADAHRADAVSDLQVTDAQFAEAVRAIYALRAPVVFELGASSSRRAWVGAVRSLVQAAAAAAPGSAASAR